MAKFEKRLLAEKLRKKGTSIKDIATLLGVSKSTASIWCRSVELNLSQKKILRDKMIKSGHCGRVLGAKVNHDRKVEKIKDFLQKGRSFIDRLSHREKILVIASLYWGEGSKKDSRFSFSNSDPVMIKLVADWLREEMHIERSRLAPRLFINLIHKPRLKKVLKFWSNLLELPVSQFGHPVLINSSPKKIYSNYDNYYGIIALKVSRSSELKYEVLGYIEAIKKNVGVAQLVVASDS